jgi:squalene synthase HpnC
LAATFGIGRYSLGSDGLRRIPDVSAIVDGWRTWRTSLSASPAARAGDASGPRVRDGSGREDAEDAGLRAALPGRAPHEHARRENFTVAAKVLPPSVRAHLLSIYVYARLVDDIGDESAGDRMVLLDKIGRDLDAIYAGRPPRHTVLHPLVTTIERCGIPREPFDALLEANRRDQHTTAYAEFSDLLDYCAVSANPVGHLVLYVFGQSSPRNRALADAVCSALQVLEHIQDVAEDYRRGRVYLPEADMRRFGVCHDDLAAPRASRSLRALVAFEVARANRLLDDGAPLIGSLHGLARVAVAGYLAGGRATARAVAAADYDVLAAAPKPSKPATAAAWTRALRSGAA